MPSKDPKDRHPLLKLGPGGDYTREVWPEELENDGEPAPRWIEAAILSLSAIDLAIVAGAVIWLIRGAS